VLSWQDERPAVLGDAVDGVEQFPHGGDQRDLGEFAVSAQPFVEGAQPGIAS
jgi:hypothetical protein